MMAIQLIRVGEALVFIKKMPEDLLLRTVNLTVAN